MTAYNFYTDSYYGTSISADEWPRLATRAAEKLSVLQRTYTLDPLVDHADDLAICALADAAQYFEVAQSGGLFTSSTIGSVSSSSGGVAIDTSRSAQESAYVDCLRAYYDVYRGVRRWHYR